MSRPHCPKFVPERTHRAVLDPSDHPEPPLCAASPHLGRSVLVGTQTVADPGFGQQVARLARVGLEFRPQVLHAYPEAPRVIFAPRTPHLAYDLTLHHDRAELPGEAGEHPVLERGEMGLAVRAVRLAPREVALH